MLAPTAAGLKPVMDAAEALSLAKRACPQFASAGLAPLDPSSITKVETRSVARLWAGMGSVVELRVKAGEDTAATIMAKKVTLPKRCASIGDRRKKASYEVECNFYEKYAAEVAAFFGRFEEAEQIYRTSTGRTWPSISERG